MSNTHEQLLKQLEEQSKQKQEQFLNHIAAKLKRPRVMNRPSHPFRGAPAFWQQYELDEQERLMQFTQNFEAAGGYVSKVQSLQQASAFITEKAIEMKAKYVMRQDVSLLEQLGLEQELPQLTVTRWNEDREQDWKSRAAETDIGVVLADYAVAHTGSIVLMSSKEKGRSVSLLPTLLVAIIPRSVVVTKLGEVLGKVDEMGREALPAGIHFVSGPSRSADIENDLTIGVHGPGLVYAVIVDEL